MFYYHSLHPFWFIWPIGWFIGVALLALLILLIVRALGRGRNQDPGRHESHNEAEAILRRRLASGEIDEAEYERLRTILRR